MKFKDTKYGDLTGQNYAGHIDVSSNNLTSLEGAPQKVYGSFHCRNNNLSSLEGAPHTVQGHFHCSNNNLTSLEGAPQTVQGSFDCSNNKLTSLEHAPKTVQGYVDCGGNRLISLKGLKGISSISSVYCKNNPNGHLGKEFELRKENPKMLEEDIDIKMYELTQLEYYLPQAAKDIFLF